VRSLVFIWCLLACAPVSAQKEVLSHIPKTVKQYQDFVPAGYAIMAEETGDLDKDGKDDVALILKSTMEDTISIDTAINRILVVALRSKNGYSTAAVTDKLIKCRTCGGPGWDDPYNGMHLDKGVLIIDHFGGGMIRWSITSRFRYQNGNFYLVGSTKQHFNNGKMNADGEFADADYTDVNYVTGQRERRKIDSNWNMVLDKTDKIKVKPLIRMVDYKIY